MQTIKVDFKLEEDDFLKYQYIMFIGSITKMLYLATFIYLSIYFTLDYMKTGNSKGLMLISLLAVAFYVVTLVYLIPKNSKKQYDSSSFKNNEYSIQADQKGVTINRGNGNTSTIPWNSFLSVWYKWGYYIFYITESNYIQLPQRFLNAQSNLDLENLIKTQLKASKRRSPSTISAPKFIINSLILIVGFAIIIMSLLSFLGILR